MSAYTEDDRENGRENDLDAVGTVNEFVEDDLDADGEQMLGDVPAAAELEDDEDVDVVEEADNDDEDDEDRDEGDIAADYIEELLDIADVDGDLEIDETGGRTYVSVTADGDSNLDKLASGTVVDALQQLTRLAVQAETGEFSRLILDVGGSREARRRELQDLVDRAIERIEEGAATAALPPMSSYERKIVHDIAAERGYASESEGEGRDRHTVLQALS